MKLFTGITLLLFLTMFIACDRENSSNPYPVWIIYTWVVEQESDIGIPFVPVRGCPQVVFHVVPGGRDSTVNCAEPMNLVKIWDHLDSVVTIEYYVHCANYADSEPREHTFHAQNAIRRPGRDGPEDMVVDTTILSPL